MDHHLVSNYETFKLIKADFLQKGIQAERFNGEHINDDGTHVDIYVLRLTPVTKCIIL